MRRIIGRIFDASKAPPLIFLMTVYIIGVTTNSLSDYIKEVVGLPPGVTLAIGGALLLLIILLYDPVTKMLNYYLLRGASIMPDMVETGAPEQMKGLIVFASLGQDTPAEAAIQYHLPALTHCWIITGGEQSESAARSIMAKFIEKGCSPEIFREPKKMSGEDADNPEKVFAVVEEIYSSLPDDLSESDVIADYTGGTKSMSAGMILSCALPTRKLQFMKPNEYKTDGTAKRECGSKPREIDIKFQLKKVKRL